MAEEGKAEDLHANLRERALSSFYFFTKVVLNYDALVDHFHLSFCNDVQNTIPALKRGYLLPRGHFKSTIVAKSYPLWRLCGGGHPGQGDPRDLRFFLISESDTVAAKNLRDIKWNLTNNDLLKWLFPTIIPPDVNQTKWTDSEILLPRTHSYDESTITTDGVGAKRTGFHFDVIIYDDPIGKVAADSEAEMNKAITYVQYASGLLNEQATSEELYIGTRWKHGTADLPGWMMENVPEMVWHTRSAVENNEPTFPERFTLEVLSQIRKRQGDYKYNCQYLNNPTDPEGADFHPDWLKEFTVGEDCRTIVPSDGSPNTSLKRLIRTSFYDPSSGGKMANAENAIVVIGEDSLRRIFILDTWSANCGFGAAIEKWHLLNDRYRIYQNRYESVGAQKAIEDIIKERKSQAACRACGKIHSKLTALPVTPPGGKTIKEERIRNFAQAPFEAGRIYLRRGQAKLRRQITAFPHVRPIDEFDALAYAIFYSRAPHTEEELQEEKTQMAVIQQARKSRIATEYEHGGYT